eukprot:TRINITY_DN153_c0_g1_i1.p1 TRINITY_DN153_c0_g1~~TRINITY_DN153_c0_g1_i1.p1  ORF type:complete len:289 (+),score=75.89 TRINITY_DN153_c0_g1_i1:123-989(+)
MKFRPCIDIHAGKVKQIVGSTLSATGEVTDDLKTNFETTKSSAEFAALYRKDRLPGGHVIMLGPNCEEAAMAALRAYPQGLHVGGGITAATAPKYIEAGASHVIVTSYVFKGGQIAWDRLDELVAAVGKEHLVLDLSCRRRPNDMAGPYYVVTDKWQAYTDYALTRDGVARLAECCDEFLVHGVEAEGKRCGILEDLVRALGEWSPIPVTYAGGARCGGSSSAQHANAVLWRRHSLFVTVRVGGGGASLRDVWGRRQVRRQQRSASGCCRGEGMVYLLLAWFTCCFAC